MHVGLTVSVCLHDATQKTIGQILMKFGMDAMPLASTLKSHFLISYTW
jgi:hypothetical protein